MPTVKHYIIRPNCSMNWAVTIRLLGLIAIVLALIAIGFLLLGLWLVLPFLGLELVFIITAFYIVARQHRAFETIEISQYKIKIQQYRPLAIKTGAIQTFELNTMWAQIKIKPAQYRNHADKLFIISHGVALEVAAVLNEDERKKFAKELYHAVNTDMNCI